MNHEEQPAAQQHTHFGFRTVAVEEKANLVGQVFHAVVNRYDLMNDLMSFGLHRVWKYYTILIASVRPGQKVLDLAAGTGDLALQLARKVGDAGMVVMSDINPSMLARGRERIIDAGLLKRVRFVEADAETLPFLDNEFDCITMAFGLRNVTDQHKALQSIYRTLKPGGKTLILEFSQPNNAILNKLYELYSFNVIPRIGEMIVNDRNSYQYLVESIRRHPNQIKLKSMMEDAGFEDVEYMNFLDGIVALHTGYKY